ncbi:hypothetical protein QO034_18875 [Sedimentitalea sp. JM2-8]|uniref:DNA-directed DNA polymerase n=1 Tax=Sedimentitalea xiamensis TaxID=3050037 RepID=A0ABT7FJ65_9RHOB|nr:hypothetical protein [Sedimentitalea xiamensis]MDK3075156.1 hypothetical protein [Sedimentitalea xiamensis]
MTNDFIYDIETYVNMFSCDITHVDTRTRWVFEVSDRRDQSRHFFDMLFWLKQTDSRLFGYNNEGFDWPVCQHLADVFAAQGFFTARDAYDKAQAIIDGDRFAHTVWPRDRLVTQGDLYKIHHFDNMARSTSLKKLEINMRSARVVDLPYSPHEPLTSEQMDEVIAYMCHDVGETLRFYEHSRDQIKFRDDLALKYPDLGDVLNFNDTKIGKKYFERELERRVPGSCYVKVNGRRQVRQTIRDRIALCDVISPKVMFTRPEFQRILDWLNNQVLERAEIDGMRTGDVETKGVLKDVGAVIDGFGFDFGTGGIHGSVKAQTVRASETHDLIDVDVASYYPNLAISNRWFPEHLSEAFCDIYSDVYEMRKTHKKGTAENAMLKLALNGVYGDSNNKYSPFYDPQYTMSITVNGQLYLCMLAEWLLAKTGGSMVQINTDGLTMLVPKMHRQNFNDTCAAWERHTGLELEHVDYSAMHIRDVNSYIAVKMDGSVKRIGAYAHETPHDNPYTRERQWHQDHSALVVRKAAEAALVHGVDVAEFIKSHTNPFDFLISIKVPRTSTLTLGDEPIQNTTRYYISTVGCSLTKTMPPLKGKTEPRKFAVQKGWNVTISNDVEAFDWSNVNWLYYIEEARKLLI